MSENTKALKLLDQLINKLQANTGGELQTNPTEPTIIQQPQPIVDTPVIKQDTFVNILESKKQSKEETILIETSVHEPPQPIVNEPVETSAPIVKTEQAKIQHPKSGEGGKTKAEKKQKAEKKPQPEKKKESEAEQELGPKYFSQIDMRIAQIVQCWKHPESENLYCEKIFVCGQLREIASGLQKFVPIEQMKGKVIVMANLKPRPLVNFLSNGMVVCSSNEQHTAVELIIPEGELGSKIFLQGHEDLFKEGPILPVLNPKRKIVDKCLQHFRTDAEGYVIWKGIYVRSTGGRLKSNIINGHVG